MALGGNTIIQSNVKLARIVADFCYPPPTVQILLVVYALLS